MMIRFLKFFIIVFMLFNCNNNPVPKPKNLLDEDTMENILLDLAILQAGNINAPLELKNRNIEPMDFICKKYKIDTLTFNQNNKYYAGNIRKYKHMQKRIIERIDKLK